MVNVRKLNTLIYSVSFIDSLKKKQIIYWHLILQLKKQDVCQNSATAADTGP